MVFGQTHGRASEEASRRSGRGNFNGFVVVVVVALAFFTYSLGSKTQAGIQKKVGTCPGSQRAVFNMAVATFTQSPSRNRVLPEYLCRNKKRRLQEP